MEEKNSKGISDRGNHMCKDRFEGSRPVLGSARSWKCLKHRISVEVAAERGFQRDTGARTCGAMGASLRRWEIVIMGDRKALNGFY